MAMRSVPSAAIALVLVLLIEGFLAHAGPPGVRGVTGTHDAVWVANEEHLAKAGDADVLFLGDSTIRVAVSESLFEEITGRKCLNLGLTSALGPYGDVAMFERYLAAHRAPRVVVVGHAIDGWSRSIDLAAFAFTRPSPGRILQALAWRDPANEDPLTRLQAPQVVAGQLLRVASIRIPSIRHREWLRRSLLPGLDPGPRADEAWPSPDEDRARIHAALAGIARPCGIAPDAARWFRELVTLARAAGSEVLVVRSPLHVAVLEDPLGRALVAESDAALERLAGDTPGARLVGRDFPAIGWDEGSGDKDHVGAAGVEPMTRVLAALVVEATR